MRYAPQTRTVSRYQPVSAARKYVRVYAAAETSRDAITRSANENPNISRERRKTTTKTSVGETACSRVALATAASLRDFLGYLETRRLNLRNRTARRLAGRQPDSDSASGLGRTRRRAGQDSARTRDRSAWEKKACGSRRKKGNRTAHGKREPRNGGGGGGKKALSRMRRDTARNGTRNATAALALARGRWG